MRRMTSMATACVAAVLVTLAVGARAQDFNTQERTFLTFNSSVELPGMTLPAGTYTFRLADMPSRNVVQILSEDEKQIHGQFLFVPAERAEVAGETVITFRETREGSTPAVQYWYYPGEKIGKEFIYPKDQAMRIAQRTGQPVRTEEGLMSADGNVSSTDAQGQRTEWTREPSTSSSASANVEGTTGVASEPATTAATAASQSVAPEPASETVSNQPAAADRRADTSVTTGVGTSDQSAVGTSGTASQMPRATATRQDPPAQSQSPSAAAAQARQPESLEARTELPRTASPLALSGLLGLLSLAGAFGIRKLRS